MTKVDHPTILKSVLLNKTKHLRTGKTKHYVSGMVQQQLPYKLKITKYSDIDGVYLIHLNKKNEEISDTYHETIKKAQEQAEWEFKIEEEDWE